MAKLKPEFDKRNTKVIGLSDRSRERSQRSGSTDIKETQGHAVNYPMIGDSDLTVAKLYDMIHPNATRAEAHRRRQRHDPLGVRHRPRQEGQGDDRLPDEHRPQLRRGAAAPRLAAS